jgi:hypothetical protein
MTLPHKIFNPRGMAGRKSFLPQLSFSFNALHREATFTFPQL